MIINALIVGGAALASLSAGIVQASPAGSGDYAAAAIASGEFDSAERTLQPTSHADAADPARLINIATVFARTQRLADARAALMRVQALPDEQLELANGANYSSHRIGTAMLQRLGR
ncbi:MAG TPA: hypothetical protein VFF84_02475 [Sphingobium sp.]|nr:hypothetical protein [Sphingobium sp.]